MAIKLYDLGTIKINDRYSMIIVFEVFYGEQKIVYKLYDTVASKEIKWYSIELKDIHKFTKEEFKKHTRDIKLLFLKELYPEQGINDIREWVREINEEEGAQ